MSTRGFNKKTRNGKVLDDMHFLPFLRIKLRRWEEKLEIWNVKHLTENRIIEIRTLGLNARHALLVPPSGDQSEQRKSCWSSSGPVGRLSFSTQAPPCSPSATTSTESALTTPKVPFSAGGFQLKLCRPGRRIWLLPLPRPPVSPPMVGTVTGGRLRGPVCSVTVSHTLHSDRGLLSPSGMEGTRSAQWAHLPVQTGVQEAPAGSNSQLHCCHRSHRGGKQSRDI